MIFSEEPVSQFFHVERAHQDRARTAHSRHDAGIGGGRRIAGVYLGAGEGHQPFDIEQVLHGIGNTGERRQHRSLGVQGVDRGSLALGTREGLGGEAI